MLTCLTYKPSNGHSINISYLILNIDKAHMREFMYTMREFMYTMREFMYTMREFMYTL